MNGEMILRFIPGIWLGRATESDEHIVGTALGVYTARTVRAKNDPRHLEQWPHQEYEGHTLGTAGRGEPSGNSDARGTTPANDRLEREHENSQRILG